MWILNVTSVYIDIDDVPTTRDICNIGANCDSGVFQLENLKMHSFQHVVWQLIFFPTVNLLSSVRRRPRGKSAYSTSVSH
jgi:hypothetical protein